MSIVDWQRPVRLLEAIFLAKEDCYVIFAPSKKAAAF